MGYWLRFFFAGIGMFYLSNEPAAYPYAYKTSSPASLSSIFPRAGPLRIDKSDHRLSEALGHLFAENLFNHLSLRLALKHNVP